jgi:molybdopterin converting factor small subunit
VFDGDDLHGEIIIFVNGRNVRHLQMLDTPLQDDDEVSIFPMIAGG